MGDSGHDDRNNGERQQHLFDPDDAAEHSRDSVSCGIAQPGDHLGQRKIDVGEGRTHHPGVALRVVLQHALKVVQELRQARRHEVGGAPSRFGLLLLVVQAAADRMVGVVDFRDQVGDGELKLVSPASCGRTGGSKVQPRAEILQNVGRLPDQLPSGPEKRRREGREDDILTFQETPSDVWDPIRQRLKTKGSRLRTNDASFLVYSLLDANIDRCFPILEHFGDRAEELEILILEQSQRNAINDVHQLKRDLLLMRRNFWPMREVVSTLQREPHECVSDTTRVYLRDLYDHVIQIIDIIEIYREITSDLTETHMSAVSNHMNEIMKVLTMIGTIFIPLTFLAGVYGMNFRHLPELDQVWAYPAFWAVCLIVAGVMVVWFRRRKWM